jgi:hypothetical protein
MYLLRIVDIHDRCCGKLFARHLRLGDEKELSGSSATASIRLIGGAVLLVVRPPA